MRKPSVSQICQAALALLCIVAIIYLIGSQKVNEQETSSIWPPQVPVSDLMNNLKESGVRHAFQVRPVDGEVMRGFNPDEPYLVLAQAKDLQCRDMTFVLTADYHVYPVYNAELLKIPNGRLFRYNVSYPGVKNALQIIEEKDIDLTRTDYDNTGP